MGAEDIGIPERRGILDLLKSGGAKVRDTKSFNKVLVQQVD